MKQCNILILKRRKKVITPKLIPFIIEKRGDWIEKMKDVFPTYDYDTIKLLMGEFILGINKEIEEFKKDFPGDPIEIQHVFTIKAFEKFSEKHDMQISLIFDMY